MSDLRYPFGYAAWLRYSAVEDEQLRQTYANICASIGYDSETPTILTAAQELADAAAMMIGIRPEARKFDSGHPATIQIGVVGRGNRELDAAASEGGAAPGREGYVIRSCSTVNGTMVYIAGQSDSGALYGTFHFIRLLQMNESIDQIHIVETPMNGLRMINHWDNMDGSIERGYAGKSIFFRNHTIVEDLSRIRDYARLLASVGINAISINNVNVHQTETKLIDDMLLPYVVRLAKLFRSYGIRLFLSINFAAPIAFGGLQTADPLDIEVRSWWAERTKVIYKAIPDFGGFLVKADSEFRPGPFTYGRDHADGANMLAEALQPHGGLVIWRCFVYNCLQDWRDRSTDRAKAAYDHFTPLDGRFADNVILQIKNGPMDFQVREPVSPLFGGLSATNQMLELQVTQEYTGHQIDLCYLVPQWKEVLEFDTYAKGEGSTIARIVNGELNRCPFGGIAAISNIGDDIYWTGHPLAQANLFGYGRLIWNPSITTENITSEWIRLSLGDDPNVVRVVTEMLHRSWPIYESYTAPLGVGWMVTPHTHYGPSVDGYEYSKWGTYHFADMNGIGVDRTIGTGTGYAAQYHSPHRETYNSLADCPDELLLFFHHVRYTHKLKSGATVIQHIYDTHFDGAQAAQSLLIAWQSLEGKLDNAYYERVKSRLLAQIENACQWRDVINTYFYRKSGIGDEKGRHIY